MKKIVLFFLILFILVTPSEVRANSASSSIVMDMNSGRILYQHNAKEKMLVASITKIMTALIALEHGDLDEYVTAGEEILTMYGSSIYLELNEKMTLESLLYGLMLRSGNDAAVVIANHISETEEDFVILMNEKAKELGMRNTTFLNSHGLDEETRNYSTAYDMAILTKYVHMNHPKFREISKTVQHEVKTETKSYLWYNRNKLLNQYEFSTGGKTGYTPSAGKTLVSTANKRNLELVIVTLDDEDSFSNHQRLYEEMYNQYRNYTIIRKESFHMDPHLFRGKLSIKESFVYPLSEEETEKIITVMRINNRKRFKNGEKVGYISVQLNNEVIRKVSVYAQQKKGTRGFFRRLFNLR